MDIAVFGALGRVGKSVTEVAKKRRHNVWEIDENYEKNKLTRVDAVIDFSDPSATEEICDFCKLHRCALVTGTTGRNAQQQEYLENLKNYAPVSEKANFSQGMETVIKLAELAAKTLPDFDVEIVETHRNGKKDSPSGTAKTIAATVAKTKGSFSSVTVHSLRCGTNFGKHEIVFGGTGESLVITHQAEGVEVFAAGAVSEAEKIVKKTKESAD